MNSYRLSADADDDLDRIFDYGIDTFGMEQALKYYDALEKRFDELAENPFLYPAVDHIRQGYRRSVCGVHSIYYRVEKNIVEIMRIIKREDISRAF